MSGRKNNSSSIAEVLSESNVPVAQPEQIRRSRTSLAAAGLLTPMRTRSGTSRQSFLTQPQHLSRQLIRVETLSRAARAPSEPPTLRAQQLASPNRPSTSLRPRAISAVRRRKATSKDEAPTNKRPKIKTENSSTQTDEWVPQQESSPKVNALDQTFKVGVPYLICPVCLEYSYWDRTPVGMVNLGTCGHCVCDSCAVKIANTKCPLCGVRVKETRFCKLYFG